MPNQSFLNKPISLKQLEFITYALLFSFLLVYIYLKNIDGVGFIIMTATTLKLLTSGTNLYPNIIGAYLSDDGKPYLNIGIWALIYAPIIHLETTFGVIQTYFFL